MVNKETDKCSTHIFVKVKEVSKAGWNVMCQKQDDGLQVNLQLQLSFLDERLCLVAKQLLWRQQALVKFVAGYQLNYIETITPVFQCLTTIF